MNRDRIVAILRRFADGFRAFTLGQKIVLFASIIGVVAGVLIYLNVSSKPTYAPLFTNLAPQDASAIVDKLSASGTSYQLADAGQTVMVPQADVYSLRLQMSSAGLPANQDTGYALLDKIGVTTSDFMQQVDYQRALEGELANTIKSIDGVTSATVHLAIPKQDVFSDSADKPTASVLVATSPGKSLAAQQVEAIVHLVASSVVGLDPSQVTVAGADGTVLSEAGQITAGGATGQDQQTLAYENRLDNSLQQMLDLVVGPNHAKVQVTADLNFDQTETKSQTYSSAANVPPLSQSNQTESYTGTGGSAGGVLGQTNGTINAGGNGTYSQSNTVQDNAVNTVIQTSQSAPGQVRKLGVAVLLDQASASKVNLATIQQLASSAVGLNPARGDTIAVAAMPFDQTAAQQNQQALAASAATDQRNQLISLAKIGAAVLGVLAVLLITFFASRKRRKRNDATANAELLRLDELKAELERNRAVALESTDLNLLPAGPSDYLLAPAQQAERENRIKEIEALVDEQPDEVARLLRGWLATKGS